MLSTIQATSDRKAIPKQMFQSTLDGGSLQFNFPNNGKIYHVLSLYIHHTLVPANPAYIREVGLRITQIDPGAPNSQFIFPRIRLFTNLASDFLQINDKNYDIIFSQNVDSNFRLRTANTYFITQPIPLITIIGGKTQGDVSAKLSYEEYGDSQNQMSGLLTYIEESF